MDIIQLDDFVIKDFQIDVGTLPNDHKGLLGLDILKQYKFVLDLDKLELYTVEV